MPTAHGFCLALRRTVLDQIGGFDPAYGRGYQEENDWCQRARGAGFLVGRANRAFVYHHGAVSFGSLRARLDVLNARRLLVRYPTFRVDCAAFEASAEARVAADAVARQLGPQI
jgi:GT2 family glycosyltransferase